MSTVPSTATRWNIATVRSQGQAIRLVSLAGMVVPGLFFMVMIVLGQITPRYDAISRFGSELSLGRYAWAMIANFIVLGLSVVALSSVLRRVVGSQRSGRLGAAMIGVAGIAFLVAGIFVTDPSGKLETWHGALHMGAALVLFFLAIPAAGIALARRFRSTRRFSSYSAMTAVATPILFFATFMSGHVLGLMERILIGTDLAWLTVVAVALFTGHLSSHLPENGAKAA